jgi:polyphosphate kinase
MRSSTGWCPDLAKQGIAFLKWRELPPHDQDWLRDVFDERIFPVLTPLAVDPSHPFPYISNLSLNLGVRLRDPLTEEVRFARLKVPQLLDRFLALPDGERFVPLEQVIAAHLDRLFPGMSVVDSTIFRVTRNTDLILEEDDAEDLLAAVQSEVRRRRFGGAVRLEVDDHASEEMVDILHRRTRSARRGGLSEAGTPRSDRPVGGVRPRPSRRHVPRVLGHHPTSSEVHR